MSVAAVPTPTLAGLLRGLCDVPPSLDQPCGELCLDHRDVGSQDIFVALGGGRHAAHAFIAPALAAGALAVLCESELTLPCDSPEPGGEDADREDTANVLYVPALREQLPTLVARRYGSLDGMSPLIGVTGTNGKTTVAWLCAAALAATGRRSLYVGTLGTGRVTRQGLADASPTRNTTPDLLTVRRRLAQTAADAACIEMSSHALAQGRLADLPLDVAVLTNLGRDHLDYHGSLESYRAAKFQILHQPGLRAVALNVDDPQIARALEQVSPSVAVWAMGTGPAGVVPTGHWVQRVSVQCGPHETRVSLRVDGHTEVDVVSRLLGRFHAENLCSAFTALCAAGLPPETAAAALAEAPPVAGRFQRLDPQTSRASGAATAHRAEPVVLVDYAHTPEAIARLVEAVRELYSGTLFLVVGCGGDRDVGKRRPMGAAAAAADVVVVTSDNPRSEDPETIAAAVVAGVESAATPQPRLHLELDRAKAIGWAVAEAANAMNDNRSPAVVVIAGKGHESTQEIAGEFLPFDDVAVAEAALAARGRSA